MASRFCVTGAIKFGDELTVEQCASVLRRLARCRLPFQCAHGRPSCVPLYNISSVSKAHSGNGIKVSPPKNDSLEVRTTELYYSGKRNIAEPLYYLLTNRGEWKWLSRIINPYYNLL